MQRSHLLSGVAVAAGPVVPVDGVLFVQLHSGREVCDGLVVLEEAVPYEAAPVVRWRVLRVQLDHLVEVLQGQVEPVAADLLPDRAQVVDRLHVGRLQLDRAQVVFLSLGQVVGLVPAEGAVVVGLEVAAVELDRARVVRYRSVEVALLPVSEAPVVIEVSLPRLDLNRRREAVDGFVEVAPPVERDAFVVVRVGVLGVDLDGRRIVRDRQGELSELVVGEASIEQRLEVVRVDLEGLRVQRDGRLVVALLASGVALRVEGLRLRLQLWVERNVGLRGLGLRRLLRVLRVRTRSPCAVQCGFILAHTAHRWRLLKGTVRRVRRLSIVVAASLS